MNKSLTISFRTFYFSVFFLISLCSQEVLYAQNCSVNAGISQTFCSGEQILLQGNKSGLFQSPTATWSQVSGPAVIINSPNSLTTNVSGTAPGNTYTFRLVTTCQDGTLIQNEVTYTILPVTFAHAGPDQELCPTAGLTLAANPPGAGETGEWALLDGGSFTNGAGIGGSVIGSGKNSPNATGTLNAGQSGASWLVWTISNPNGCLSHDTVKITNRGGVMPVTAGGDQFLSKCYTTTQFTNLSGSNPGSLGGQSGTSKWIGCLWKYISRVYRKGGKTRLFILPMKQKYMAIQDTYTNAR